MFPLRFGWIMVTSWSWMAQSEYEHCTASGLQGPRVNLTYRFVAQHTASCPLAGVVGCVLPTCAQGSVEPSSRWLGEGENKWSSFWGIGPPFVNPGDCPLGPALGFTSGGSIVTVVSVHPARRRTSPLGVVPVGLGDGVGDCHDVANSSKSGFLFPFWFILGG